MYTNSTRLKQVKTALRLLVINPKMLMTRMLGYRKQPLFLFQMGKVASKTHDNTLSHLYFVQHFHTAREFDAAFAKGCRKFKGTENQPYDIITATRDPITRKISGFFQNITEPHYNFSYQSVAEAQKASVEELVAKFQAWEDGINEATGWFEKHFQPKTEIDVYDSAFDPAVGWQVIESEKFRVLIVKFEDIKKNHVDALNELVTKRFGEESKVSKLEPLNLSEKKWYSSIMGEFKKTISFTKEELDEAYCSKYMRHFYSAEQIQKLRAKWE